MRISSRQVEAPAHFVVLRGRLDCILRPEEGGNKPADVHEQTRSRPRTWVAAASIITSPDRLVIVIVDEKKSTPRRQRYRCDLSNVSANERFGGMPG